MSNSIREELTEKIETMDRFEICQHFNISQTQMYRLLKRYDLALKIQPGKKNSVQYGSVEERNELIKEFAKTLTRAEIAEKFDVTVQTVVRWAKKGGFEIPKDVRGLAEKDAELKQLIEKGLSAVEIAEELGYEESRIRGYCKQHGLTFKPRGIHLKRVEITKMVKAGSSLKEIAEKFGYSTGYVRSYCRKEGIKSDRFGQDSKYRVVNGVKRIKLTHRVGELRQWAAEGKDAAEIAELTGFNTEYVYYVCRANDINVKHAERKMSDDTKIRLLTSNKDGLLKGYYDCPDWGPIDIEITKETKFVDYYRWWVHKYKVGIIRDVSVQAYRAAYGNLVRLLGDLKIKDLTRTVYQDMMTEMGTVYHIQTARDYHNVLKASINDAVYEGLIAKNPTYKAVISGNSHGRKKSKFISERELTELLKVLDYGSDFSNLNTVCSWFIYLTAKTGFRFGETLGLTVSDFNFESNEISINKTWDYKNLAGGGFAKTKNKSSIRTISLDPQTMQLFKTITKDMQTERPIWLTHLSHILNPTINDYLEKCCKKANIKVISTHSLRHTHASVLLAKGVSMISISKRLGHSNLATTQKVYSHITEELERKDDKILQDALGGL